MKTLQAVAILLLLSTSAASYGRETPLSKLHEQGCDVKLEKLARDYLESNKILVSIYEYQSETGRTLEAQSLKLCASQDMDQGSWSLRRETVLCNTQGDVLTLYTFGDLWCSREKILGIKSLVMAPNQTDD